MAIPDLAQKRAIVPEVLSLFPSQHIVSGLIAEDSNFIRAGRVPLSKQQEANLRSLFSRLGFRPSIKTLRDFLKGNEQQMAGSFSRLPWMGKDARKNLELFLKKYGLILIDPSVLKAFQAGYSFVIGGRISREISQKDIQKMRKMGILVSVKDGECYIRNREGALVQKLANSGLLISVNPNHTAAVVNNLYFPSSMPEAIRAELQKAVSSSAALAKAGKHRDAFYIHNLFLNVVSAYQQLDLLQDMKPHAARADVNIRKQDFDYLLSSSGIGTDGFQKIFGIAFKDFLKLKTIGRFSQYKIANAEHILNKSVKAYLSYISGLSKSGLSKKQRAALLENWKKQSQTGIYTRKFMANAQSAISLCHMIKQNRENFVEWKKITKEEVVGTKAKRLTQKATKTAEAKVRRYFYAIEGKLKRMLFFSLAAGSSAVSRKHAGMEYSSAQLADLQKKIQKMRKAVNEESVPLNDILVRAGYFKFKLKGLLKGIDELKNREKDLTPFEKNSLLAMRTQFETQLLKRLDKKQRENVIKQLKSIRGNKILLEAEKSSRIWDVLKTALEDALLEYNPKTAFIVKKGRLEFDKKDSAGSLYLFAESHLGGMFSVTWRLEKAEDVAREMAVSYLRSLHKNLKRTLPDGYSLLQSPVQAVARLADALESRKLSTYDAGNRFVRIIDSYGKNLFITVTAEAREKLKEIAPLLKKHEGAGVGLMGEWQQNVIKLLFRGFLPGRVLSVESAMEILEKARYQPTSFFAMHGKRVGKRFKGDETQLALYIADLVNVAYSMSWNSRYLVKYHKQYSEDKLRLFIMESNRAFNTLEKMIPKGKRGEFREFLRKHPKLRKMPESTRRQLRDKEYELAILYSGFARKLNDVLDELSFEKALEGIRSGYKRFGYRVLRFLDRNLDLIMGAAFMAGMVAGIFSSAGTLSTVEGAAARQGAKYGIRKILQKYGWQVMKKRIGQKIAGITARSLARSGMAGVTFVGKGIMAAAAVPMAFGAFDYIRAATPEMKEEGRAMFEHGLSHAFMGLLSSYGPVARSARAAPWLRRLTTGSEVFLVGGTSFRLGMMFDSYFEGRAIVENLEKRGASPEKINEIKQKYYPGAMDVFTMGMDMLYASVGAFRLVKSVRGVVRARAGKAVAGAPLPEKVLKGDIFLLGLFYTGPFLSEALVPEEAKKEWERRMLPTRKGVPVMPIRPVDYVKLGVIPKEIQLPPEVSVDEFLKAGTPKKVEDQRGRKILVKDLEEYM